MCYSAPEVLSDAACWPTSSDVYCLGMIAWEMWYGQSAPQHMAERHGVHLKESIKNGERPTFFTSLQPPTPLRRLIEECWCEKQEQRPTLQEFGERVSHVFS